MSIAQTYDKKSSQIWNIWKKKKIFGIIISITKNFFIISIIEIYDNKSLKTVTEKKSIKSIGNFFDYICYR